MTLQATATQDAPAIPERRTGRVCATVPATTANLGPGFDCLGMALELRNRLTLSAAGDDRPYDGHTTAYSLRVSGVDAHKVPDAPGDNLAVGAVETLLRRIGRRPEAIDIDIDNCVPVGSGLGSSSSAIIGALVAMNALYGEPLPREELLQLAVDMEGHPDNVAPAMLGGLVLGVIPDDGSRLVTLRWEPPALTAVVVLPDFHLLTSEARAVLPSEVSRGDAIYNAGRLALLVHALTSGDYRHLREAMGDRLHQARRLGIIPGAKAAFQAAYDAGALGVALSGAGPSLLALTQGESQAIAGAMAEAFAGAGLTCRTWVLHPAREGATLTFSAE